MLMSLESESEIEMLQKDVAHVCKAMLAFPSRLPFTQFYRGLQVNSLPLFSYKDSGLKPSVSDLIPLNT